MKAVDKFLFWCQVLVGVVMSYSGVVTFFATSGFVQGTEFQMLITLANQLSLLMCWLSIFSFRTIRKSYKELTSESRK